MPPKCKILLTGSTGFVGSVLLSEINSVPEFQFISVVRSAVSPASDDVVVVGSIDGTTDYSSALNGVDVVVHAAARAHIMRDEVADPLVEYRKVNVEGALNLAKQAVAAGVKRFVYISSVKVNGESTTGLKAFTEADTAKPEDPYGVSKHEAEEGLRLLAQETGLEVVIIRPPLVYGPGVKANFLSLLKLSVTGLPLPFGSVNNHRSMVYVGNLVSFIICCIHHPAAANQTFLVSDGEDVSLRKLVTFIRLCLGRSPCLLPVPLWLFKLVGAVTGKQGVVDRLVGDLQVDSSKARTLLEWVPPFTVSQGIEATVADFMSKEQ
ncbi:SDR family oxidoreductase [Stutzerimonas stutzeri]|uniref:UDP-glucose 4-epimerase family protein n=1 Tax=Stutzerimonas stutzeri TaxID=316 RepID=UPI000F7B8371|nr:SDR family oxidoreductase [Stutzerimonas stutzeri]RRV88265.1 SDR family oxidoreductase [Stutzerimonas stutzeri]RRV98253.1 SDR family oxidoreductase [Stutzerimonas stutzeri]RRW00044.1 SDR family oxidoreductase [Stutzerimonas stutzeri]RRW02641.1 SDR family oxidoreductase [Stutzerimonas stutzeri]